MNATRASGPRRRFASLLHSDITGSWVLVAAVAAALIWANSRFGASYASLWHHPVHVGGSVFQDFTTVQSWVNGGLMAIFFFVVGLEIAREWRTGELSDPRTAVVPVAGAIGGMIGAGLVFVAFNHGGPGSHGWGIPMATDIAFALGALALLGSRVPPGLRLLLLTLAVADDIGSVVVLAVFYSSRTNAVALVGALVVTLALVALVRRGGVGAWPVLAGGAVVWVLLAAGGVEPALAGVIAGVLVPGHLVGSTRNPAERLETSVAPVSAFIVLPLFALANAGIVIRSGVLAPPGAQSVFFGIAVARVLGKLIGITAACALVVRIGLGRLPEGIRWGHVAGGAAVAGIGFTVPLLIAEQAFVGRPSLITASELGLLIGSALAFVVGAVILVAVGRRGEGATGPERSGDGDEGLSVPW
jgi:NhaA family Na+:H+ antiporter